MKIKTWVNAVTQSRDKDLTRAMIATRRVVDFIGRISALLALLFICYGFVVEGNRSERTKNTADQAKQLSMDVARLTRENREILRDAQEGRRTATIQTCARDRREHDAITDLLIKFHVSVPDALGPVDCKKRLADAGLR